jgi:hypothetical protein
MPITAEFLGAITLAATRFPGPKVMLCPRPGDRVGMAPFDNFADWQQFVLEFTLPDAIPAVVRTKFERVQKQYIIAWGTVQRLGGSCRHSKYRLWIGARLEPVGDPRTERSVVNRATNLKQKVGAAPGPSHLLRLVHSPIDQEIGRAFGD